MTASNPTFKLQKYAHFNHELTVFPVMKKVSGGICILIDRSASMSGRMNTLEAVLADLRRKCGATKEEMPTPTPAGSTALCDAAYKFANRLKTATFFVVTDGDDTSSKKHFTFARFKHGRVTNRWIQRKRVAVLDYLEKTLRAKIVLLGIGDGAKELIRAASRKDRRINCAHIADDDTGVNIQKVMDAACAEAERKNSATKTRVITAKSVNAKEDEDFWGKDDDFLDDEEEAVESEEEEEEGGDDDDEDDDDDDDVEEPDSADLCDDGSEDEAPSKSKGKKRAAPARASTSKRAKSGPSNYEEGSDEEDDEDD